MSNPQAFPTLEREWDRDSDRYLYSMDGGMTLRDYFASKALAGMCANTIRDVSNADIAKVAYSMADAMLKARDA